MNELKRILKAAGYSMLGFKAAYKNEPAFRTEIWVGVVLLPLGFWLAETTIELILLTASLLLVLLTELLNSAIEVIVDRISTENHELSGRAKDIGSAAVFVSLVIVIVVWSVIIISRFV